MSSNPFNLLIRFLLEVAVLFIIGMWGWKQSDSWHKYVLAILLPIILAAIWGIFAVPNDPSRSGETIVITPGIIRLCIELGFFTIASWALYDMDYQKISLGFTITVVLHYLVSYDRILWLLAQK